MTKFVGGPYDGRELPIEPEMSHLWLPPEEELDTFLREPTTTARPGWLSRYWLDNSVEPPVYRFAKSALPAQVSTREPPEDDVLNDLGHDA